MTKRLELWRLRYWLAAVLIAWPCTQRLWAAATATPHERYGAYWTNAGGYQSTIQIHNNLVGRSLSVTPVLYTASGEALELPAVVLSPLGNASVDVNEALVSLSRNQPQSGAVGLRYVNTQAATRSGRRFPLSNGPRRSPTP